jgi:adenylate kinase
MIERRTPTILVFGVSGVGKTQTLDRVVAQLPGSVTWRASEIIGVARNTLDPEALRKLPLDEIRRSQELLLQGFTERRSASPNLLVLLDAHSVIDTESGLVDIPVEVAARLGPSGIIHVSDDVARILERRLGDQQRVRPARSLGQLEEYQQRSVASSRLYSATLGVPLIEVRSGDRDAFMEAVRRIGTQ